MTARVNTYRWVEDSIDSTCGSLVESLESDNFSTARAKVKERTEAHYHQKSSELYIVLQGRGKLRVKENNGGSVQIIDLDSETEVLIESGTIHQVEPIGDKLLVVETVNFPPWQEEDQVVVEESLF